jgi:RNA polymerase sigma-70 factor (ECF subfamily)
MQKEEHRLIKECAKGNREAYAVLVERYQEMVYNTAYRMLGDAEAARDMAQESFISAYGGLKNFRNVSKFSTWLYSIVINKCRDYLRVKRPHTQLDGISDILASSGPTPEEELHNRQIRDRIQDALNALPEGCREAVVLKHIEGLDYREMESILGISAGALKVRTHRGREMLRKLLEEKEAFDGQR